MGRTLALLVGAIVSTTLQPAVAQNAAPVRHLIFNVRYSLNSTQDVASNAISNVSGLSGIGGSAGPSTGSNTEHYTGRVAGAGSIVVDVLGVTKDQGLLVQAKEDVENRNFGMTKFAIRSDGNVAFDPKAAGAMNAEIVELLQLLATKLLGTHDLAADVRWTDIAQGPGTRSETTFRVVSVQPPDRVNLEIDRVVKASGAQAFDATTHAKMLYDVKYVVPVSAVLLTRTHMVGGPQRGTTLDETTEINLGEDSFQKKS